MNIKYKELIEAFTLDKFPVPSDSTLMEFLEQGDERDYPAHTQIIKPGHKYKGLFLIANGVGRIGYFEGDREKTFGFGGPGTFFLSPKGYLENGNNSFFIEACSDLTVLEWSKSQFLELMSSSHELCLWMFNQCINQFLAFETRLNVMHGSARERYELLFEGNARKKLRTFNESPDFMTMVPAKVIASYLDITPAYLSNIRKEKIMEQRNSSSSGETREDRNDAPKQE